MPWNHVMNQSRPLSKTDRGVHRCFIVVLLLLLYLLLGHRTTLEFVLCRGPWTHQPMNPWTHEPMNQSRPLSHTIVVFIVGSSSFCFFIFSWAIIPLWKCFFVRESMNPSTYESMSHEAMNPCHESTWDPSTVVSPYGVFEQGGLPAWHSFIINKICPGPSQSEVV